MDLIDTLATRLGLEPQTARALAGAVLGAAREQAPAEETQKLDEAVPEIDAWSSSASEVLAGASDSSGSGGLLGALAGFAGSGTGNELVGAVLGESAKQAASVVAIFEKLGLETSHAAMAAPVVLDFLEERVGEAWTERIVKGAPMLMSLVQTQEQGEGLTGLMGRLWENR